MYIINRSIFFSGHEQSRGAQATDRSLRSACATLKNSGYSKDNCPYIIVMIVHVLIPFCVS